MIKAIAKNAVALILLSSKGLNLLNNTEAVSNVCLICVNTEYGCAGAVALIENSLSNYNITALFVSALNIFSDGGKIYIAVHESDLFLTMNALGSVRSNAGIINYSINCSNCMIKQSGKTNLSALSKAKADIKLLMQFSDECICFCDNYHQKRICSLLSENSFRPHL